MPGTPPTIPPRTQPPTDGIAALRRMEARLVAGRPPGPGELETPWEAYLAAVRRAGTHRRTDLATDVVDELRADHDALVRSLRARALAAGHTDERQMSCRLGASHRPVHPGVLGDEGPPCGLPRPGHDR